MPSYGELSSATEAFVLSHVSKSRHGAPIFVLGLHET